VILTKEQYTIPRDLMDAVLMVVGSACFIDTGDGDEANDDDVIAVYDRLKAELEKQGAEEN
jgi:hypothetical protein